MKSMKIMKWLAALLVCGMTVPAAMGAALVTKGSSELGISGKLDFATEVGTDLGLQVKYAYFFWDRISLGLRTTMGNNDAMNFLGIGVTGEYNFALPESYEPIFGSDLVPYLGLAVDYRHANLFDEQETAVMAGAEVGVKFFLTDSTAVTLSMAGEIASEDIYANELEPTNTDLNLQVGMRLYF
jgi:hypothetical protein